MTEFETHTSFANASKRAKEIAQSLSVTIDLKKNNDGTFTLAWRCTSALGSPHESDVNARSVAAEENLSNFKDKVLALLERGTLSHVQMRNVLENREKYYFTASELKALQDAYHEKCAAGTSIICQVCFGDGGANGRCFACGGTGFR